MGNDQILYAMSTGAVTAVWAVATVVVVITLSSRNLQLVIDVP
jgi:hypothetical protein